MSFTFVGEAKEKAASVIKTKRANIADIRLSAEASEALGDTKTADEYDIQADELEQEVEDLEAQFEKEYSEPDLEETEDMKDPDDEAAEENSDDDDEKAESTDFYPEDKVELPTMPTMTEASRKAKEDKKEKEEKLKQEKQEKKDKKEEKAEKKEATMIDGFGFDKSATVVEQGDYSNNSEVSSLESMWNGKPSDIE